MFSCLRSVIRRGAPPIQSYFSSKVPDKPEWTSIDYDKLPEVPEIDLALVEQLERISLVEFNNEQGLKQLQDAVKSANLLHHIDTEGVEPLDSVFENRHLFLREDRVTEGNCLDEILSNATKVEEQYFVTPPGNIPIKKRDKTHFDSFFGKKSGESDN